MSKSIKEILEEYTEGDDAFTFELRDAYLVNLREFSERATRALSGNDKDKFRQALHKIRPSLITLQHFAFLEELDKIKNSYNTEDVGHYMELIRDATSRLENQLRTMS